MSSLVVYDTPCWLKAFSTGKDSCVEDMGFSIEDLALPRQTHSSNVLKVAASGRPENTDAVFTGVPGLCVCVKTADCIPVLLYDDKERIVAAIHAGWRGTVGKIVSKTISEMGSAGQHLHAIIGPGISQEEFEVGDEVYDAFLQNGFPMHRIAKRYPSAQGGERWHIDLWDANRWLLEQHGVKDIHVAGICTKSSPLYYSARRETINTGRNYNGILILP